MKTFILFLFLICQICNSSTAQENTDKPKTKDSKLMHNIFGYADYFEWFKYYDEYNGYIFDSLDIVRYNFNDTNNIWHVCHPNKGDWTTGCNQPSEDTFPARVLITDSINPYPINNFSTVEFHLVKPAWTYIYNFCWSSLTFDFMFKCESDTVTDGLFVEVSFDGGLTFANAQDTTGVKTLPNGPNIIDPTMVVAYPTQLRNSFGISGNMLNGTSNGWYSFVLNYYWDNQYAHDVDYAIVRMNFVSDSINTIKRGIVIDNVYIAVQDWCFVSAENNLLKYSVKIFPNPVTEQSVLSFSNPECEIFKLEIVDNNGKMIFERETNEQSISLIYLDIKKGMYYYRLSNKYGDVKIDKFVKM